MTKQKLKKSRSEKTKMGEDPEEKMNIASSSIAGYREVGEPSQQQLSRRLSFVPEVSSMLYAYGDVRHPLVETATLVEEIVYQQMCQLLKASAEVATMRSSNQLGLEEFLFLLRGNKMKIHRFMKRMEFLDKHKNLISSEMGEKSDVKIENPDPGMLPGNGSKDLKRRKICEDFLDFLDESGDLLEFVNGPFKDNVKVKRMERAELQTRDMGANEYMEYVKCRQISFATSKGSATKKNFRDWFDFDLLQLDLPPSPYGWDALEYFAQETVGELVDMCLLVRSENILPLLPCEVEPNARHMPMYASSSLIDRAEILKTSNSASVKTERDDVTKFGETKKRKSDDTSAASGGHSLTRKLALTTDHVREAMRRFASVNTTKTFFSQTMTVSNQEPITKLLCLT